MTARRSLATVLAGLPAEFTQPPRRIAPKIVVLDDDPTGTQTVHGIPVLTRWDTDALVAELRDPAPAVFLLTNTRAFPPARAVEINHTTGAAICAASRATGIRCAVISRGDSTLRGHFPAETDALAAGLGGVHATFLIPAFFPGGRYTIDDIHYVADGPDLVPAGETEFARDATFGYRASRLPDYIEEKSAGRNRARDVISLSLAELRSEPPGHIADRLLDAPAGAFIVVNAAAPSDLAALTHALSRATLAGRRYLYRTAASFVAAAAALDTRAPLAPAELRATASTAGGLLVAGSHVHRTSAQLDALFKACPALRRCELDVPRLLDASSRDAEINHARAALEQTLAAGRSAVLYTSRKLVTGADPRESLALGARVSTALVEIVRSLAVRPTWFVAKGGITSSDLATGALGIRRAEVLGQALPGVPVWRCGSESKWPGLAYVVFPGNVGGSDALAALVAPLLAPEAANCRGPRPTPPAEPPSP